MIYFLFSFFCESASNTKKNQKVSGKIQVGLKLPLDRSDCNLKGFSLIFGESANIFIFLFIFFKFIPLSLFHLTQTY